MSLVETARCGSNTFPIPDFGFHFLSCLRRWINEKKSIPFLEQNEARKSTAYFNMHHSSNRTSIIHSSDLLVAFGLRVWNSYFCYSASDSNCSCSHYQCIFLDFIPSSL